MDYKNDVPYTDTCRQAVKQNRIQKKIETLSEKRKKYIRKKRKKQDGKRDAFDRELLRTLKKQAKRANITYE